MNVLMTADTVGGVWNYSLQLCRALSRHGVHVTLATMGPAPTPQQRRDASAVRNVDLRESGYRLEWMERPWADVDAAGEWLLRLEQELRPDVVHLNGYVHGALPWSAPKLVVGHSCVLSWWRAVHGVDAPAEWQPYRDRVSAGLRAADTVVAPTQAMLDALDEHYGSLSRARVIMNGRESDALPLGARDGFGRYPRRESAAEPLVLAAGRLWDPSKNIRLLAEAAPAMHWPVFVAGSDTAPDGGSWSPAGVHRLGMLPPQVLRQWYRRASILVHPALYEPFGLVPLEAALEHCALVLADIPSLREVWGDAATYVDPRDPAALARTCNEMAACPARLWRRAEEAARRARELNAARMARAYIAEYRDLMASRRPLRRSAVAAPQPLSPEVPACA